jgi:hypothetical protein
MSRTITIDLLTYRRAYGVRQVRPMSYRVANARGFAEDAAGMDDGTGLTYPAPFPEAGHAPRPVTREHRRLAIVQIRRYAFARQHALACVPVTILWGPPDG